MRPPIVVRPLTDAERQALTAGLRSKDTFVLRRCQILLASARGERAPQIATHLGCDDQTVLDGLHAFNARGLDALAKRSSRAHHPRPQAFPGERAEQLRALLHRRPRDFGHPTSLWTLELAAEVSCAQGLTTTRVSGEDGPSHPQAAGHRLEARQALDHQPRSGVCPKKRRRDRLIALTAAQPDWALGFADEVWWSRLAQPQLHSWADQPLRLIEQTVAKADPDPKALACYGLLLRRVGHAEAVWLRFVTGRPVSAHHHPVPGLVLPQAGGAGRAGVGPDLGQRLLAREQSRPRLDPGAQPRREAAGTGRASLGLLSAGQESLAQPD